MGPTRDAYDEAGKGKLSAAHFLAVTAVMAVIFGWALSACSDQPSDVGTQTAPVASDDVYSIVGDRSFVVEAPGVASNDAGLADAPFTVSLVTGPTNGSLTLSPSGAFVYEPAAGFVDSDSFEYMVGNSVSSDTAIVKIGVSDGSSAAAASVGSAETAPGASDTEGADAAAEGGPTPTDNPASSGDATTSAGATKFASTCAGCHGRGGEGGVGPALANRAFTPAEIEATILAGRGIMPSFSTTLSAAQVAEVVDYVIALAAGTAEIAAPPQPTSPEERFSFTCASCHGPAARGTELAPDIAGEDWDEIFETVREGEDEMPAFSVEAISNEDLAALAAYINGLAESDDDDDSGRGRGRGRGRGGDD